jgi:dUTP pyrophosphatase
MYVIDKPIPVIADPELYYSGLTKGSIASAGYDLKAKEATRVYRNQVAVIKTGLRVGLHEAGLTGMVSLRSSMGRCGLIIPNSPGIIDSDYTGEIMVQLSLVKGDYYDIERGQRFAQLVLIPNILTKVDYVEDIPETERGDGGFGSTGK